MIRLREASAFMPQHRAAWAAAQSLEILLANQSENKIA
jgi:hypothetical protein